jgi:hypothetical protein
MSVQRVIEPFAFTDENGVPRVLRPGDLVDEKDPAAKKWPHFFESVEATVVRSTARASVEQATAGPGEKRAVAHPDDDELAEYATGGGWYEIEGEKYHGREAALDALTKPGKS